MVEIFVGKLILLPMLNNGPVCLQTPSKLTLEGIFEFA